MPSIEKRTEFVSVSFGGFLSVCVPDSREEMILGSIPLPSYEIRTAFSKEKKNRRFVFKVSLFPHPVLFPSLGKEGFRSGPCITWELSGTEWAKQESGMRNWSTKKQQQANQGSERVQRHCTRTTWAATEGF